MGPDRTLVRTRPPPPTGGVGEARSRVRQALEEIGLLDAEVEALSRDLDDFARTWDREVGPALAALDEAEALVRRLQRAEDELDRIARALRLGEPPAGRRGRTRPAARRAAPARRLEAGADLDDPEPPAAAEPGPAPEIVPEEVALKRLWRRLARILHPDLASGDADRERLSSLMARVNAAYEAGDLAALELMAERVGAGEDPEAVDDAQRLEHLARREAALDSVRRSLAEERSRLRATATARLREEAHRRARDGGDALAEARQAAATGRDDARGDARARLARLWTATRELARLWRKVMEPLARRGPTGALRPFDPLAESPLVRRGAALLEGRRASPSARELARWLEERAAAEPPWELVLTLLAYCGEIAGVPPETLSSAEGYERAWADAVAGHPGSPDLLGALARLPRHLALGVRLAGRELAFGVHLASPDLAAGVRIALARDRVAAVARQTLPVLGPPLRCGRCRRTRRALHLLRTRGLDEVHGLVCPTCGAVLRSYWQYGEPSGLEALADLARELGLVAELPLTFAGAHLTLEMLPSERERLTAAALRRRIHEVCFAPYRIPVDEGHLVLVAGRRPLGPRDGVPPRRVELRIHGGPMAGGEVLDLLRARIERRFRDG